MKFRIDNDFAQSAEKLLQKLIFHDYRIASGILKVSNTYDIVNEHRELFEIDIVKALDANKYPEDDLETVRLYKHFCAGLIHTYKNSKIIDDLINRVNAQSLEPENKDINLFNLTSKIKTEKKRDKRNALGAKYSELCAEFIPILQLVIDNRNETSLELGYGDYTDKTCRLSGINLEETLNLSKQFLNDTEYIYKDLVVWQLKKKLGIKLEDANHEDLLFLLNSFELKDHFKQTSALNLSTRFLGEIGIPHPSSLSYDFAIRQTKTDKAGTYPVEIPGNILISIYRIKTVEDYEGILGGLGSALIFSSIDLDDTFENKRLLEPLTLEIFKYLFKGLIFEGKWLKRYLRLDIDRDFLEFLNFKRLTDVRTLCANVLIYTGLYRSNNIGESLSEIPELYYNYMFVKPNENMIFFDIIVNKTNPVISFNALQHESYLNEFMVKRFDEQWWREREAGVKLNKWWNECSHLTPKFFEQEIVKDTPNITLLISNLEKVF